MSVLRVGVCTKRTCCQSRCLAAKPTIFFGTLMLPHRNFQPDLSLELSLAASHVYDLDVMSAREIIEELPHLSASELQAIEQRIAELAARNLTAAGGLLDGRALRAERLDGRLLLSGPRTIRQAEVEAILAEFP